MNYDISNQNKKSFAEILFILLCVTVIGFSALYGFTYAQYEYKTPVRGQATGSKGGETTSKSTTNVIKQTTRVISNRQQINNNVKSNSTGTQSLEWVSKPVKDIKLTYAKVNEVVDDSSKTDIIIWKCSIARSQAHCINLMLGISKAESSIFRRGLNNNYLGIKPYGNLAGYETFDDAIEDWVRRYNTYWYTNDNAEEMLRRSKYCVGGCQESGSNWRRSVDSFIGYIE